MNRIALHFRAQFEQFFDTGKFLSEALFLPLTNPQYDNRLFIELQVQYLHENYQLRTCCVNKLF